MIASLGMYDFGDVVPANDRYWALIASSLGDCGIAAPETLSRSQDFWQIWQSPDLVLAQTCGFPYRARLHGKVALIGTPDYGLPDCPPGYYRSLFVARKDDARKTVDAFDGARLAYNDLLSQSGWVNPQLFAQSRGITLPASVQTGAHRASAQAVADCKADIAAVDAVTWRHMVRNGLVPQNLHVIDRTDPVPGLPLIASKATDGMATLKAVRAATMALNHADCAVLGLLGIVEIPAEAYLSMPNPPSLGEIAHSDYARPNT